jgi:hypothetical protein
MTFTIALTAFVVPPAMDDNRMFDSRGRHNSRDLPVAGETGDWSQRNKTSQFLALHPKTNDSHHCSRPRRSGKAFLKLGKFQEVLGRPGGLEDPGPRPRTQDPGPGTEKYLPQGQGAIFSHWGPRPSGSQAWSLDARCRPRALPFTLRFCLEASMGHATMPRCHVPRAMRCASHFTCHNMCPCVLCGVWCVVCLAFRIS